MISTGSGCWRINMNTIENVVFIIQAIELGWDFYLPLLSSLFILQSSSSTSVFSSAYPLTLSTAGSGRDWGIMDGWVWLDTNSEMWPNWGDSQCIYKGNVWSEIEELYARTDCPYLEAAFPFCYVNILLKVAFSSCVCVCVYSCHPPFSHLQNWMMYRALSTNKHVRKELRCSWRRLIRESDSRSFLQVPSVCFSTTMWKIPALHFHECFCSNRYQSSVVTFQYV